jgi:hypothetical protein
VEGILPSAGYFAMKSETVKGMRRSLDKASVVILWPWVIGLPLALIWYSASGADTWNVTLISAAICIIDFLLLTTLLAWNPTSRKPRVATGVSLLVLLSIAFMQWPLRLSFAISRPALERMADQVAQGRNPAVPARIGLIVILRTELRGGTPCLWTADDPTGPTGFIRVTAESTFDGSQIAWSYCRLADGWRLFSED